MPALKGKLDDGDRGLFTYVGFVESAYLNECANNERTAFSFSTETNTTEQESETSGELFADQIGLKQIRSAALEACKEDLKRFLDELTDAKDKVITRYVVDEAPQYRPLLRDKSRFYDGISPDASKGEIDTVLHRQLFRRQQELRRESQEIAVVVDNGQTCEFYSERFKTWIAAYNELGVSALAEHVLHRKIIIEILSKALSKNEETGKYVLEEVIHDIVFPMRTTSDEIEYEQQNLWLLDERLTHHLFLSSDKPLRSLEVLDSESANRPDILIFNNALVFSEEDQALSSIVLIEFKKPDRRYVDEDPLSQVFRILRDVRSSQYKDKNGRLVGPLSEKIPAYCYVICDLTSKLENKLIDMSATKMPDNQGYFGFNPNLDAYYEVISYGKMLNDAKKRNRILFERLNVPLN